MSIELPKDAEGREIPLDTKVMYGYGGTDRNIVYWVFTTDSDLEKEWRNCWRAVTDAGRKIDPGLMYLTPPDTWEKLEEDLRRAVEERNEFDSPACGYTDHLNDSCNVCRFQGRDVDCSDKMLIDIASRIRKLRGEDDAD